MMVGPGSRGQQRRSAAAGPPARGRATVVWGLLFLLCWQIGPAAALAQPLTSGSQGDGGDPRLGVVESYVNPDAAWALGARWERVTFQWSQLQPDGPGEWLAPTTPTIEQVRRDHDRGVDIVGLLIATPGWAQATPDRGVHSPPAGLDLPADSPDNRWATFCRTIAQRYGDIVGSWIIWNEPDVWDTTSPFYTWSGDAATYYQLVKVASQAIKAVQPGARIVLAGTTFYWDANAGRPQFLGGVLDAAVADPTGPAHGFYFDAVAAHVYTTATNAYWVPHTFRHLLADHHLDKPVWIDELNVPPYDDPAAQLPAGAPNATLAQQRAFMVQAYAEARAAGVARIGIYKLVDVVPQDGAPYGLLRNDGSQRPAYGALHSIVGVLGGLPDGQLRVGQHHLAISFADGAHLVTVAWNTGPTPYALDLCARGTSGTVIGASGAAQAVERSGPNRGFYHLPLPPATAHGVFDGRDLYYIGGDPLVVVEDGVTPGASCAPAPPRDARYFAQTGYRIDQDAFWAYFQARGGVATFGYPISRTIRLLGFTTQLFQRQAMQLDPAGHARLLNLLDAGLLPYTRFNGSQFPPADQAIMAAAPAPGSPGYATSVIAFVHARAPDTWQGQPTNFAHTFERTVGLDQAFPSGHGEPSLLPLVNLEIWGLPTSAPAADPTNHNFVYQRFQRGVMHYDAGCRCTQGILFGDYLKEVITNQGLPADLTDEVLASQLFRQYDPDSAGWLARPDEVPGTDLTFAFERG